MDSPSINLKMCYGPHTFWLNVCVLFCNICVCVRVCVLSACQSQSTEALHLGTHWPSAQQPTPWRTDRAVCEPTGNVCACVWDLERGSRTESLHRCVKGWCVCECVWGLAAELALWNSHVMLFLLPSLNISRAEDQCVEYKVTKKGLFVCFRQLRETRSALVTARLSSWSTKSRWGPGKWTGNTLLFLKATVDLLESSF